MTNDEALAALEALIAKIDAIDAAAGKQLAYGGYLAYGGFKELLFSYDPANNNDTSDGSWDEYFERGVCTPRFLEFAQVQAGFVLDMIAEEQAEQVKDPS